MLRSKLFALAITMALHGAVLIGIVLYRSLEILVSPTPEPLVVTLLPLVRPAAVDNQKDQKTKVVPAPKLPVLTPPIIRPIIPDMVGPREEAPPAPISPPSPQTVPTAPAVPAPIPDAAGNAVESWEGRVLARLERFKRFPAAARSRREQGVATLRFRLDRQGRVLSSSIARSSGSAILDREALATLARAQPLPPIPADRPDEVELFVPIEFFIQGH